MLAFNSALKFMRLRSNSRSRKIKVNVNCPPLPPITIPPPTILMDDKSPWNVPTFLTIGLAVVALLVATVTYFSNKRSEQIAKVALQLDSSDHRQDSIIGVLADLFVNSKKQLDSMHYAIIELTDLNTKSQQQLNLQQAELSLFTKADQRSWEDMKQKIQHMADYITYSSAEDKQNDTQTGQRIANELKKNLNEMLSLLQTANTNRYLITQPYIFNKIEPLSTYLNHLLSQMQYQDGLQETIRKRFKRGLIAFTEFLRRPPSASSDKEFTEQLKYAEGFRYN